MEIGEQTNDELAKSIFLDALEIAAEPDRLVYLDRRCGTDHHLRAEVDALLHHEEQLGDYLERPALDLDETRDLTPRPMIEGPGTGIGPYKLMEQIGEGGMGVVYVAEQTVPVRRRVALKVIKPGMDSRQVIARFEAERQALAMMDHPNIARVFDGGTTPDSLPPGGGGLGRGGGRPYFVMELVRGIPITDYCDAHKLTIRERLELFVLVCRAVQHAHQKGIIHRDLKPSNILVTLHDGVPVPKVIDFGVAKATGSSLTDKTVYTAFTQLIGTPLYMSPEQVELSGLDIDTRSDIYSLGVLLYELLTGTTPFDADTLRNAAFDEMRRIIREQEPQSPSMRLSSLGETLPTVSARRSMDPRRLGPSLRGELDWVVMKALEKDRRRRYETANDFASDVMRYLTDQPVEACPPSTWYRFRKFASRNRRSLTTAALVAAALLAGTAVSVWQAAKAREAAAEAGQRAKELHQVVDYLAKDMFGTGAAKKGKKNSRSVTVGELLDQADCTLGQGLRLRPLVEANVRVALAWSYLALYEYSRAEQNATRAVQILESHRGSEHPLTLEALYLRCFVIAGAGGAFESGRPNSQQAEALARRVLTSRRRVLGLNHADTISTQILLAHIVKNLGRYEEAERLASEAETLVVRVLGPENENILAAWHVLGSIAQDRGEWPRAEARLRRVIAAYDKVYGVANDGSFGALRQLAEVVLKQGRTGEARALLMEAVNRALALYGLPHIKVSGPMGRLFAVLREQRDYAAIRDLCEGWLRELLAMPPERDRYERERRSLRLSTLALTLITLPEPIPFDGELAARSAEQGAAQGDDGVDNNWTRLSLVHLRLGQVERAQ
jgi:serine/threonine protein kinase/tetratricopeptide (TPR) repeat protein